jgi:hypothetical protein
MSGRALETDEPSDERVVPGVGPVCVALAEDGVQPPLRRRKRLLDRIPEATKARRTDGDEQRFDRLDSQMEVGEPAVDELPSGQAGGRRHA